MGREKALALCREADEVVACKGKKVTRFDLKAGRVDPDQLAEAVLGPTGNLRAPAMRVGRTLLVGFGEETLRQYLLGT